MESVPAKADEFTVKASVLRGYIATLRKNGLLDAVRERVSPQVRRYLDSPPPPNTWMPMYVNLEIGDAVVGIGGFSAWRKTTRDAVMVGLVPVLRAAIEGFFRFFGASPATLYSRLGTLTSSSSRATVWFYRPTDAHSGVMTISYPDRRDVSPVIFNGAAGGLEAAFDVLGVEGSVSEIEMVDNGLGNIGRVHISWASRSR